MTLIVFEEFQAKNTFKSIKVVFLAHKPLLKETVKLVQAVFHQFFTNNSLSHYSPWHCKDILECPDIHEIFVGSRIFEVMLNDVTFSFQAFGDKRHRHRHDLHIFWCLQCASVLANTCNVLHHALLHHYEEADQGKIHWPTLTPGYLISY